MKKKASVTGKKKPAAKKRAGVARPRAGRAGATRNYSNATPRSLSAPTIGSVVSYAGRKWTIAAVSQDTNVTGWFVDLTDTVDPTVTARIHTANLVKDTTGGYTWLENRPPAASRHYGDPRFTLAPENQDAHLRFQGWLEAAGRDLFARSSWSADTAWEKLPQLRRDQMLRLVRAVVLNLQRPALPAGVTLATVQARVMAALPQDLKDWLIANPQ